MDQVSSLKSVSMNQALDPIGIVVADNLPLLRRPIAFPHLRNRRDAVRFTALDHSLHRLATLIRFPMPDRVAALGIENRMLEKRLDINNAAVTGSAQRP